MKRHKDNTQYVFIPQHTHKQLNKIHSQPHELKDEAEVALAEEEYYHPMSAVVVVVAQCCIPVDEPVVALVHDN